MSGAAASPLPVRSALEMLQLEFPHHRITMRVIADKPFYLAEAAGPRIQPRFVQAETIDRLRRNWPPRSGSSP